MQAAVPKAKNKKGLWRRVVGSREWGFSGGGGVWSGRGIRKTHLPAITWTHFVTRNLWLRSHKVERITLRNRSVEPPTVLCSPFISAPNSSTLALSHTIFFLDGPLLLCSRFAPLNYDKVSLGLQDQVELISRPQRNCPNRHATEHVVALVLDLRCLS